MQRTERSSSDSFFLPTVWAVALHTLIFLFLFVSLSKTAELPPAQPVIQATLYQAKSQSQATTRTTHKIAGEGKKTAAPEYQPDQVEQRKIAEEAKLKERATKEQQEVAQEKAEAAEKADQAKAAKELAEKMAAAAKAQAKEEAAAAARKAQADAAAEKAAKEKAAAKKAAEDAKKKAAADKAAADKAAADKAKKAEEAKKAAAAAEAKKKAADDAKKKQAAEKAAARKAYEDKKAQAQADLLGDSVEREQTVADTFGDQTAGSIDDALRARAMESWTRPPSARNGMTVVLAISMLPDGTISNVSIARSSGDSAYDNSAVSAVRAIGRVTEAQALTPAQFAPYRSFKMTFRPEDLEL